MTDKLNVNTIVPDGSTLTVGTSGGSVVMTDDVKVNTVKDAGGNTLWVSDGSGSLSSVNSAIGGAMKLLSTQTVTDQASVSFTSGIDSTYKEYVFKFININPATDNVDLTFQASTDGGSAYGVTCTDTYFRIEHTEADGGPYFGYHTGADQAESTDFIKLPIGVGNGSDESASGELQLFNPASTTYVKNWYSIGQEYFESSAALQSFPAGYFNTTTAINAIQFKMSSGNLDGKIKMYGVL